MLEGFTKVMEILANKISRKAAVVTIAMTLIYFIAVTPTVTAVMLSIGVISGLAVFFTLLQWWIDVKVDKKRDKKMDNNE